MTTASTLSQADLFDGMPSRQPVVVCWGGGTDSTAMILEMITREEPIDLILIADTGDEHPRFYAFVPMFMTWLKARGIPVELVRYQPKNFKNWPPYQSLGENCITNQTLPSIAFGFSSCSLGLPIETVSFARDEGRADRRANPKSWRWSARPSRRAATLKRRMRRRTKMPRLLFKPFVSESISLAERWPPL